MKFEIGEKSEIKELEFTKTNVKILEVKETEVTSKGEKFKKLTFVCENPDTENDTNLDISEARVTSTDSKIVKQGMWIKLIDGKLPYNSTTAIVLRYLKTTEPSSLVGKEVSICRGGDLGNFWVINTIS